MNPARSLLGKTTGYPPPSSRQDTFLSARRRRRQQREVPPHPLQPLPSHPQNRLRLRLDSLMYNLHRNRSRQSKHRRRPQRPRRTHPCSRQCRTRTHRRTHLRHRSPTHPHLRLRCRPSFHQHHRQYRTLWCAPQWSQLRSPCRRQRPFRDQRPTSAHTLPMYHRSHRLRRRLYLHSRTPFRRAGGHRYETSRAVPQPSDHHLHRRRVLPKRPGPRHVGPKGQQVRSTWTHRCRSCTSTCCPRRRKRPPSRVLLHGQRPARPARPTHPAVL
mmetsp:Transcript_3737/g.13815  ORF Transcript_3737/g.13815 Transcript_3737/m.13815 type:complete len:271 (-) Transcript_3737:3649-4461(-)